MKAVVLILCLFVFSTFAEAENNCDLPAAPILLGLKLYMSPEQAQLVFGRDLKIKVKKKGQRTFFQNYINKPANGSLAGVRALYLRFFDGRLYQFEIFYENRQDLKILANITDVLAAQLNFDSAEWKIENNRAELKCGEISVVADNILNPRVEVTNETIQAGIEAMRESKDNK